MSFERIMSDLKERKFSPVYFLMGEEPYYIDLITDYMADHILKPEERSFNQMVIYGRETDIRTVVSIARRYPMMATQQVIIVKEAQQLKNLDELETYLAAPLVSTILVFAYKYKKIDKRTKIARLIGEKGVFYESAKLWEDKVPAWIMAYLKEKGYQIDQKSATLLVDFLGSDLGKIGNELDKLILVMPAGSKDITAAVIEKNIGISKDYNAFELTRALASRDVLKSNKIIRYFNSNPKNYPYVLTIGSLFYYFTKVLLLHSLSEKSRENVSRELGINFYFAAEYIQAAQMYPAGKTRMIISLLREYDLKAKGGSMASEGDLLKELIFKIIH